MAGQGTHDTDNPTLGGCLGHGPIRQTDADFLDVVGRGIDASHDTLVISLEEDGDERKGLDSNIELGWRELLP